MRSLRKTYEVLQVQSALERAEKRLEEAVQLAKKESSREEADDSAAQKAVEDAMSEFKKAAMEEQWNEELKKNNGVKKIYGYSPELSSHSKIENNITEIDDDKKELVASILGPDVLQQNDELLIEQDLLNEDFHDGYEALDKIAAFNSALKMRGAQSAEAAILSESEEYEMKCFNENDVFNDDTYEAEDILPTEFYLDSFDDEEEIQVQPYDVNRALILGDVIPPEHVSEETEDTFADSDIPLENDNAEESIQTKELLEQAEKQANELLEQARMQAQKIISEAQQEAQAIIDEKVQQAMEEAAERGYSEGFEKGNHEGYLAAENAVNEGMIQEAAAFGKELESAIEDFNKRKEEILHSNLNDLSDLAVNVAEKVIKISLKSSKDVVAKMIVAAAEDCRNKQWAKVYISNEDKAIAMNLEKELIDALNQISANVKVVVMEDEPSGTCIIESPDQIVDASVGTQMDNIRQIVSDNKL